MVEIPKAMVVERVRARSGAEKADQADDELPDKLDTDTDGELLRKYGLDPEELADATGGSPAVG